MAFPNETVVVTRVDAMLDDSLGISTGGVAGVDFVEGHTEGDSNRFPVDEDVPHAVLGRRVFESRKMREDLAHVAR